ncbi:hypothetical protein HDU92_003253 [Lobulomyces angularis]|nr:hypothetical protein HDU92_003253 [Lobulomyces angularis]
MKNIFKLQQKFTASPLQSRIKKQFSTNNFLLNSHNENYKTLLPHPDTTSAKSMLETLTTIYPSTINNLLDKYSNTVRLIAVENAMLKVYIEIEKNKDLKNNTPLGRTIGQTCWDDASMREAVFLELVENLETFHKDVLASDAI